MRQKIVTSILVLMIVGMLGLVVWGSKNKKDTYLPVTNNQTQNETQTAASVFSETSIFFYGNTCPHCADVEAWMKETKIEEKIHIIKKEVYDNPQNAQELVQVANGCGLPTNGIGVPFLYAEGKCLIGAPEIINYLSEKTKTQESTDSAERRVE